MKFYRVIKKRILQLLIIFFDRSILIYLQSIDFCFLIFRRLYINIRIFCNIQKLRQYFKHVKTLSFKNSSIFAVKQLVQSLAYHRWYIQKWIYGMTPGSQPWKNYFNSVYQKKIKFRGVGGKGLTLQVRISICNLKLIESIEIHQ